MEIDSSRRSKKVMVLRDVEGEIVRWRLFLGEDDREIIRGGVEWWSEKYIDNLRGELYCFTDEEMETFA